MTMLRLVLPITQRSHHQPKKRRSTHQRLFLFILPIIAILTVLPNPTAAAMTAAPSSTIRTVMITGANGYLASHIVKQLLEKVTMSTHVYAMQQMNHPSGTYSNYHLHQHHLENCNILNRRVRWGAGYVNPGMEEPRMSSVDECMSAAAPQPEPPIKMNRIGQMILHNYLTRQEKLCQQWSEQSVQEGKLALNFRYCAICPTMIVGPPLLAADDDSYTPSGTMGSLYHVIKPTDVPSLIGQTIKETKRKSLNDSMSYIDVQDCAAQHVAAMENTMHQDELYPEISLDENYKYEGDDIIRPTQFNLDRMNSLGVKVKSIREIFAECISFFQSKGVL
ncbi:hypothetical protein QTG54_007034 [Skeletonema marinoi]|uniref:NAD-dependent epimerase/dehydratase domain-containing protein n=1 Tax=Skeletonema marinoi TaxID=267567 RepID=A0AAD9DDW7_9STRA|nr:hypothetical protein QTG54_007034 [Skeletonema marinoi]